MSEVASTKVPMGQKIAFGVGMLANQMDVGGDFLCAARL